MGAPAVAPRRAPAPRKAPARRTPARRSSAARRTTARRKPRANRALASRPSGRRSQGIAQPALAGAALIPHAAVSAAGAVRDLSDSSLIVRLTAGRGWIAVLCALLGGIVALNVVSLSINATSGRVGLAIEEYERQNSSLRAELAEKLSAGQVEDAAAGLGLTVAATGDVSYLTAEDSDVERLAKLLAGDTVLSYEDSSSSEPVPPASYEEAPVVTPSAPAASVPTAPAPAPAPAATSPPSGAGGGATGGVGL